MGSINPFHRPGFHPPALAPAGWARAVHCSCILILLLLSVCSGSVADETNAPTAPAAGSLQDTNLQEVLRAVSALGDQLRSNQIVLEQNGKEAKEAAAHNSELVSNGLRRLQETFSSQQQALAARNDRELQNLQNSNRAVALVGGIFAAVIGLTLLLIGYFQWRISKVWTQISQVLPLARGLGEMRDGKALGAGSAGAGSNDPANSSNARLIHAVEELETRIDGLEHNLGAAHSVRASSPSSEGNGDAARTQVSASNNGPELLAGNAQSRVDAWFGRGQALLKQNDSEGALQCFDEVLALAPNHGEALVKKGAVLERMKKLNEAFECYDRAIAADESMTIAYLHKGGLCSRLERFKEALECYEKALRTHSDWGG